MKRADGKQLRRAAECNTPVVVLAICVTTTQEFRSKIRSNSDTELFQPFFYLFTFFGFM